MPLQSLYAKYGQAAHVAQKLETVLASWLLVPELAARKTLTPELVESTLRLLREGDFDALQAKLPAAFRDVDEMTWTSLRKVVTMRNDLLRGFFVTNAARLEHEEDAFELAGELSKHWQALEVALAYNTERFEQSAREHDISPAEFRGYLQELRENSVPT